MIRDLFVLTGVWLVIRSEVELNQKMKNVKINEIFKEFPKLVVTSN